MGAEAWADHAHAIERCLPVAKVRRPETPYCMRSSMYCTHNVHMYCIETRMGFPPMIRDELREAIPMLLHRPRHRLSYFRIIARGRASRGHQAAGLLYYDAEYWIVGASGQPRWQEAPMYAGKAPAGTVL